MPPSKSTRQNQIRQIHRYLAPIMVIPLLLTLITGAVYQVFDLAGQDKSVKWLLDIHKGHFGNIHLEAIYPFFNSLGLLFLAITGISMWRQSRRGAAQKTT
jgi:uncharacterized iron-regulated membrane protein